MKLNLGCGNDLKPGYLNVDFRDIPGAVQGDLSKLPWPWKDGSVDEILMLDFLEHFPYRKTVPILQECWRILKVGGRLEIQVPDFTHCARVILDERPFMCNQCGNEIVFDKHRENEDTCFKCGQGFSSIVDAAVHRIFGGQDYDGNFHMTTFTEKLLRRFLTENGFRDIESNLLNQNGETMWANWNISLSSKKEDISW